MKKKRFDKYHYMKLIEYLTDRNEDKVNLTLNEIINICHFDCIPNSFKNVSYWYKGGNPFMKKLNELGYKTEKPSQTLKDNKISFIKIK